MGYDKMLLSDDEIRAAIEKAHEADERLQAWEGDPRVAFDALPDGAWIPLRMAQEAFPELTRFALQDARNRGVLFGVERGERTVDVGSLRHYLRRRGIIKSPMGDGEAADGARPARGQGEGRDAAPPFQDAHGRVRDRRG